MKRAADEQVRFFFSPKTRAHGPVVGIICTDNRHSCRKQKMGKWSRKKARIPSNGQVNTSCAAARTQNHCEATKIYQLGRFSHWGRAGSQGGQICHILSPQIKSSNARFFLPGFKMWNIVFKLWFVRYYKVWPLFSQQTRVSQRRNWSPF